MMSFHSRRFAAAVLITLVAAICGSSAPAQIPDEFTNLKILPKETDKRELIGLMRGMAGGLGVRCNYCHVGGSEQSLEGMDFASDEKDKKRTARVMMKMVREINENHLKGLETGRASVMEVTCATCHHRLAVPRPIEELLAETIEQEGMEAATKSYRDLRAKHYGGHSYDFTQIPLNSLAERLAGSRKMDEAFAMIELNIEFNPEDSWTRMLQGGLHKAGGDKEKAKASFRKALELDPENRWAKKELEALSAKE
jgi:hypothetical protein